MISRITSDKFHLTKGKTYVFEKTPKIYDPVTLKEVTGYLIQNDLGQYLKVNGEYNSQLLGALCIEHFITLAELRRKKLRDLGI